MDGSRFYMGETCDGLVFISQRHASSWMWVSWHSATELTPIPPPLPSPFQEDPVATMTWQPRCLHWRLQEPSSKKTGSVSHQQRRSIVHNILYNIVYDIEYKIICSLIFDVIYYMAWCMNKENVYMVYSAMFTCYTIRYIICIMAWYSIHQWTRGY